MSHGIRPLGPIGPPVAMTAVATARAVEAQAKVTGAASNNNLQGTMQANKNLETRKSEAARLLKNNIGVGPLNALEPMADSHSTHDDEDHSNKGAPRRRRKKGGVVPPIASF
jgi:hypothetical protein